jgi:hypothetical protein
MRKKPVSLILASLIFLYLPVEYVWRLSQTREMMTGTGIFLSVVLPALLIAGLMRVTRVGWYTLVALVALWGVRDLHQ